MADQYQLVCYWHDGGRPHRSDYATLRQAEQAGQQWGCLAAVSKVEVFNPTGELEARWDKTLRNRHEATVWQRLGGESKRLGEKIQRENATRADWPGAK